MANHLEQEKDTKLVEALANLPSKELPFVFGIKGSQPRTEGRSLFSELRRETQVWGFSFALLDNACLKYGALA